MPDGEADLRLTAKTTPTWLYASAFWEADDDGTTRASFEGHCSFCVSRIQE